MSGDPIPFPAFTCICCRRRFIARPSCTANAVGKGLGAYLGTDLAACLE